MTIGESNVVQLPDRAARSWPVIARGLSAALIDEGRDPDMVDQIVEELRPCYTEAYEGPKIPNTVDADDAIGQINVWVTSILLRLLMTAAEAKLDLAETLERFGPDETVG